MDRKRLELKDIIERFRKLNESVMLARDEQFIAVEKIKYDGDLKQFNFYCESGEAISLEMNDVFAMYEQSGRVYFELNDESVWMIDTAFMSLNEFLRKCRECKGADVTFSDKTAEFSGSFDKIIVDDTDDKLSFMGARKILLKFSNSNKNAGSKLNLKIFDSATKFNYLERDRNCERVKVFLHDLARSDCEVAFYN